MQVVNANTDFGKVGKLDLSIHKPLLSTALYADQIESISSTDSTTVVALSVIVVAYNEQLELIRLLDSLQRQTGTQDEVILVDNGLDKTIAEEAKKYNVVYIKSRANLGVNWGRNVGASVSQGETLLFLDAGGAVNGELVKSVRSAMTDGVVAMRGKVLPKTNEKNAPSPWHYNLGDKTFECYTDFEGISAWRSDFFKSAGGFEECVNSYGGVILNYRLYELFGVEKSAFKYEPSLVLYHNYNQDESSLSERYKKIENIRTEMNLRYPFLQAFLKLFKQDISKHVVKKIEHKQFEKRVKKIEDDLQEEHALATRAKWECFPDKPLFTVVIPCFNLGAYLSKAIASIKKQTLQPVEIIVVDDASPDDDTVRALKSIEHEVQVIFLKENAGVAAARNKGIAAAKSKLILCLDADDVVDETYLEKAKNVFELKDEIGLVSCWTKMHGVRNGQWKAKDRVKLEDSLLTSPLPTATCFRKSVWERTERGYDSKLRGYEDWDFWLSVLEQGVVARVIPEFLFSYLTRSSSKVNASNKNSYELVTRIVENHKMAYMNNVADVVAQQRTRINELSAKAVHKNLNGGEVVPSSSKKRKKKRRFKRLIQKIRAFFRGENSSWESQI